MVPFGCRFALRRACHRSEDKGILPQGRRSPPWIVPAHAGRRDGKKRFKDDSHSSASEIAEDPRRDDRFIGHERLNFGVSKEGSLPRWTGVLPPVASARAIVTVN